MRTLRYVLCDVFTERPLTGNGLAVFTDARDLEPSLMQALAREMNLSESVFVLPKEGAGHARIRIFTPKVEVPFAGHPTLGTAIVLGQPLQTNRIVLETAMGLVPVDLEREGPRVVFGRMKQPLPKPAAYEKAEELLSALGLRSSPLPIETYDNGIVHVITVAASREEVASLRPDMRRLIQLPRAAFSVVAGEGDRYKSRMFAPSKGVDEDPATGSAAGPIAVHLARHGRIPWGTEIAIEQGAEIGRPSMLYARCAGSDSQITEVEVGGSAVVIGRGELRVP